METLGLCLKEAREEKNYSIDDVSDKTKIRSFYIEKLENDDLSGLPPSVYTKGFLRNLARLYEVDEQMIIKLYDELSAPVVAKKESIQKEVKVAKGVKSYKKRVSPRVDKKIPGPSLKDPSPSARTGKKRVKNKLPRQKSSGQTVMVGLLLFLVLLLFIYIGSIMSADKPQTPANEPLLQEPVDEVPSIPEDDVVVLEEPEPEPEPAEPDYEYLYESPVKHSEGLDVMLLITGENKECWVNAHVDGQEVVKKTVGSGTRLRFYAQESIRMTLGNAGVVSIYKDGEDIGFQAQQGEVVYKEFMKE